VDIQLLGPIEASLDGRPVALGAPQQRAVLAMLALQVNQTVSADQLSEGLWGERAPATAPKMVQLYVSQLRKLLRGSVAEILTRGRGYELRLAVDRVDAAHFERLVDAAMQADGVPNGEARAALALWRGSPLADVAHEPFANAEIRRLEELRLQAAEVAIDADLAARRHRDVLGELRSLIADEPLRERIRAQHMLALYRSGRQSEALAAYRDARSALVEAIGVEPGPELRHLHEAILRQDPRLEPTGAVDAIGLPPELAAATPLVGREADLEWLRGQWRRALAGAGRLVLVAGERGIGKTRLVAELAAEVLQEHGAVLYGSAEASHEALAAARSAEGPTLLILDDVTDEAGELDRTRSMLAGLEARAVLVVATSEHVAPAVSLRPAGTLILKPLDADGVRALAQLYAGAAEDVEVPVERLLVTSGGVPQLLHSVTSEWARMLELRRLADSVGRITADRSGLRAAEDDLVGSIVKLQAAGERTGLDSLVAGDAAVCPYKGLASFEAGDTGFFFGRERLVAELVARATGTPFLGIVGPSGSGKTSALHAGLLAALAGGVLPGSEAWALAVLRPGEHPLRALEQALAAAPDHGRRVVAVDQFEEAFTTCRDESERDAFVDALLASVRDVRRRTLVVVAVRADYYGHCAAYPELSRLLGVGHVLVGPMLPEELRRAIELPARRAGLLVERELADALLADVEGQPGALPLVSSALLELWQRRDGRTLRRSDYEQAGGVRGAVARQAEHAYEQLDPAGRVVARRVLLRLAGAGEGEGVVRRRARLSEFEGDAVARTLDVFAAARLVTISEGEVEVAHEALLREWPRLRTWLEEDAEGRRLHLHLMHAARSWDAADRDPAELYRGARLGSALDWTHQHASELDGLERAFVAASRAEAELEGGRQRRANRRLRVLLAGVGALLALAVAAGVLAVSQRDHAREATVTADAQRVGAEGLNRERLDQALLLARAGVALDDSTTTRGNLLSALMRDPSALGELRGDGLELWTFAGTPDGRLVAYGGGSGIVTFVDAATRLPVGEPYRLRDGIVHALAFSPDGRTLAVAGHAPATPASSGLVDLVDIRTHKRRARIVLPPVPNGVPYVGLNVMYAPDGRNVIVEQTPGSDVHGPPSLLRRVDPVTRAAGGRPLRVGPHSRLAMSATADRRRLFLTSHQDNETAMIDAASLRVLRRWPVGDNTGAVSTDGSAFALGSQSGHVRLLDLRSGRVRRFEGRHEGPVGSLRFTPDGRTLVTSGSDGVLIVWDVARGEIRGTLTGHAKGAVYGLLISPDGRTVYSGGHDKRAFAWDLTGDRSLVRPFAVARPFVRDDPDQLPRGLAISPNGRALALGNSDGTVDFLDAQSLRRRRSLRALRGFVGAIGYSHDGRLLAVAGERGQVTLWETGTLRPAGALSGLRTVVQALAFSPDDRRLAVAELGSEVVAGDPLSVTGAGVRMWDVRSRAPTAPRFETTAPSLAFSPDGSLLAAAGILRPTEVRDARSGRLVAKLPTPGDGRSVAFSPDGAYLATGHYDGTGQLWSTKTWKPVGRPLEGHNKRRFLWMKFTPDGSTLATAGQDGAVALWDVATQNPIGPSLPIEPDSYIAADLSPDGSRLFAVSLSRRAVRWDVAPEAWKRHACRVAGRELTRQEWADALPGQPYRTVCRPG
jgi:WD40 repeat protein/DNA-binding SARP family transcriptional activator